MLKQFDKNDIDAIMNIWKHNNQMFQSFITTKYWAENYVSARDEFLKNKIFVYTEAARILAYIVVNSNHEIISIQVLPEIQREGIGKILVDNLKKENNELSVKVYEKNVNAMLFFKSMGFRKISDGINENSNERYYLLNWSKGETINSSFIYFDNSIKSDLIEKYDKKNKVHFYGIHTSAHSNNNNIFNINIENELEKKDNKIYIKDYVGIRNKINSIIKTENITIFFDCNNNYDFLYEVIKDVVKVKSAKLTIVMHKPFSVEGTKKEKIFKDIAQSFKDYNVVDVDYEQIGKDTNITFREAFDKRDEVLLKMVCEF